MRVLVARRSARALIDHARYFADRGLNRKDYTDPGFQASGYINPSWYSHTHEGRFKKPVPRAPVYCGSAVDEEEFAKAMKKKKKPLGDARKQYEDMRKTERGKEAIGNAGDLHQDEPTEMSRARDREPYRAPRPRAKPSREKKNASVMPPRLSVSDENTPELEMLKNVSWKETKEKRKRLFKGRLETDYADFHYSGSGLDEFTNKMKKKEEKRNREIKEFLALKQEKIDCEIPDQAIETLIDHDS